MRQIGLMRAVMATYPANKMSPEKREELQQKRLVKLVNYVKKNSPYFSALYRNIGEDFSLRDLPAVNKVEMMANFNDWVTDPSITLEKIEKFMEDLGNIGRELDGKYTVYTTSGSSGNPAVVLYDKTTLSVVSAISALRSFSRSEDMKAFIKKGKRTAGYFVDNGFYLACGNIRRSMLKSPHKKDRIIIDVRDPMDKTVQILNDFQPAMLGGYPTALELLSEEQKSGALHIAPALVMTGGEYLSDDVRKKLSEAFGCYVQTSYSCTEAGVIACECREKHFHINDDWIIVEAVDENNQPVPYGTQSAKILLTNLFNFTQPFIRYEVSDRVVLHDEPCPCGRKTIWLEIEGRTDEILEFPNHARIAPLSLYVLLKEIHEIKRFQLIQHDGARLELRLTALSKQDAFSKANKVLQEYLGSKGITADIYLSETEPQVHPKSGKFKHIYRA